MLVLSSCWQRAHSLLPTRDDLFQRHRQQPPGGSLGCGGWPSLRSPPAGACTRHPPAWPQDSTATRWDPAPCSRSPFPGPGQQHTDLCPGRGPRAILQRLVRCPQERELGSRAQEGLRHTERGGRCVWGEAGRGAGVSPAAVTVSSGPHRQDSVSRGQRTASPIMVLPLRKRLFGK